MRVLVADDHPAMRNALARLVREHHALELVGEAADGEQAIAMIDALAPDVALLDMRMPGLMAWACSAASGPKAPRYGCC